MKLTLGQRIALGFGLLLVLITAMTLGAVWQLGASASAYESAMREREREQGPADEADTDRALRPRQLPSLPARGRRALRRRLGPRGRAGARRAGGGARGRRRIR